MWELPQEKYGKQYQRARLDSAAYRCPPQHSWHRSGEGADESAERRYSLQGRVGREVHDRGGKGQDAGQ